MNCLSNRAEVEVPVTPPLPEPAKAKVPTVPMVLPGLAHAGLVDVVVGEVVGKRVGIVGTDELAPTLPTMGNTFGTGTGGVEPTPRLLISKDPKGIPVRAPPPGVVGNVDVGLDDATILLEPEPHIPDIPDVSSTPEDPEVTGSSDVTEVADDVDVPDAVVVPVVVVPDVAVVPDIAAAPELAAVAGAAVPTDMPPPSKLAVDPNISEGGVATVGHAVLLLVVGIVIVPVTPVGTGLTPGDVISVAPSGIPVGEPAAMPSGEVAPTIGVGVTVPSNCPSTCAMAVVLTKSAVRTATTNENLIGILSLKSASPRRTPTMGSLGVRLSDIGQFLDAARTSAAADVQRLVPRRVQLLLFRVERRKPSPTRNQNAREDPCSEKNGTHGVPSVSARLLSLCCD
jgi:hypothetical protein